MLVRGQMPPHSRGWRTPVGQLPPPPPPPPLPLVLLTFFFAVLSGAIADVIMVAGVGRELAPQTNPISSNVNSLIYASLH
jgi:hypothetical protein